MQIWLTWPPILYALLLVPVLALLQLLAPRARRQSVGSLVFWRDVSADAALDRARRRRLDLASVLLLAALAAVVLALSGPQFVRSEPTGPAGIIVVDCSPSVLMTDGGAESRLQKLRGRLEQLLAELPGDLPLELHLVPEPGGAGALAGRASRLRETAPSSLRPAARALSADEVRRRVFLAHNRTGCPVLLLADVSPYGESDALPSFLYLTTLGAKATNAGLIGASITRGGVGMPHALVRCFASAGVAGLHDIRLSGPGVALRESLYLSQGQRAYTFGLPAQLPERVTLELDAADDFAADNRLDLVRIKARHYRLGYVGRADPALLHFFGVIDAEVYEFDDAAQDLTGSVDVTVFVDRVPSERFTGPAILVNPPESAGGLTRTDRTGGPGTWQVADAASPLVADLPDQAAEMGSWPVFELPAGARVALRSASGDPLAVEYDSAAGRRVAVLFDIAQANTSWSYQPSFVLFWDNALRLLSPEGPTAERYEPLPRRQTAVAEVEGSQVQGEAVDDSSGGLAAFRDHEREIRPAVLPLWPVFAILALLFVVARVWMMR